MKIYKINYALMFSTELKLNNYPVILLYQMLRRK